MDKTIKYYKGDKLHDSFPERFTVEELLVEQIVKSNEEDSDFIVSATLEELIPYVNKYKLDKKYLVWCDEPVWSYLFTVLKRKSVYFNENKLYEFEQDNAVEINVMNCFTNDIYFTNQHFFNDGYCINNESIEYAKRNIANYKNKKNKACCIMGYRNSSKWNFKSEENNIISLSNLRTEVSLIGFINQMLDIYGQDWPANISLGNSRSDGNLFKNKINISSEYRYALCFENTISPFYVTEKIWQSIISGCIPIYMGGYRSTIYKDFPKNSFIDYADFQDPISLWEYVSKISIDEYINRMTICIKVLQRSLLFNKNNLSNKIQLRSLRLRMTNAIDNIIYT